MSCKVQEGDHYTGSGTKKLRCEGSSSSAPAGDSQFLRLGVLDQVTQYDSERSPPQTFYRRKEICTLSRDVAKTLCRLIDSGVVIVHASLKEAPEYTPMPMTRLSVRITLEIDQRAFVFFHPSVSLAVDSAEPFGFSLFREYLQNWQTWKEKINDDRILESINNEKLQKICSYFRKCVNLQEDTCERVLRKQADKLSLWAHQVIKNWMGTLHELKVSVYDALRLGKVGSIVPTELSDISVKEETDSSEEVDLKTVDKIVANSSSMPEADQPSTLVNLELRSFQKQALWWMKQRETQSCSENTAHFLDKNIASKLWTEYNFEDHNHEAVQRELADLANSGERPHFSQSPLLLPELLGHSLCMPNSFYINHFSKAASLLVPRENQHCFGGILADEMGMGKTIEILALVFDAKEKRQDSSSSNCEPNGTKSSQENESYTDTAGEPTRMQPIQFLQPKHYPRRIDTQVTGTLVICPMSLLGQWKSEIERFSQSDTNSVGSPVSVLFHYDTKRAKTRAELQEYDIVLTTYQTLAKEYEEVRQRNCRMASSSSEDINKAASEVAAVVENPLNYGPEGHNQAILLGVQWERIILDEAHIIKNRYVVNPTSCVRISCQQKKCMMIIVLYAEKLKQPELAAV